MNNDLATRWHQLTASFAPKALCATMWQQLVAAYEEPGRHYHTLAHIRALLWAMEKAPMLLQDKEVVQLAAWFHDAVYNPLRSDNEVRSAALAQAFLAQTTFGTDRTSRVVLLIKQTKDHTQHQPHDPDLHFFLDVDLQILGAPAAAYAQYAQQIRQEYWLMPAPLYRRGRRAVLQKMLAAPVLYRTNYFRTKLEASARRNLQQELDSM